MTWVDGVLAGGLALLILVAAGTLREMVFLRRDVAAIAEEGRQSVVAPGKALPEPLSATFGGRLLTTAGQFHHLVFLGTGCGGCAGYAERLGELVTARSVSPRDVTVIVAGNGGGQLVQALRTQGITVVTDDGRRLADAASVSRTPTTISVEAASGVIQGVFPGRGAEILLSPAPASPPQS